jgi:F-type H+-transporting ATPase subunit epsilon
MYLEIVTPDKKVYEGEISLIKLPGSLGSFEILKNHAPIISTLEQGAIKIIAINGEVNFFNIGGGVVECSKNKIIVLAEPI